MSNTRARQPLHAVNNGAQPRPQPHESNALRLAITSASVETLRKELLFLSQGSPYITAVLAQRMLVRGKDVVRYHTDSASEDVEDLGSSDGSSDGSSEASGSEREATKKIKKTIAVGDEGYTARLTRCENCNEEFDVTSNERGDCVWHSGNKEAYHDTDFWADHDPDCHGEYEDFVDDADFAEGFLWVCCEKLGDGVGCKVTKHKAKANLVVAVPITAPEQSKKRKAPESWDTGKVKKW